MCSKISTSQYTQNYYNEIEKAKSLINDYDTIIIGAGSGLSSAAGLLYTGERFTSNFSDFIKAYNLTDMYSSAFYPFNSAEVEWAYWSRHININRYEQNLNSLYYDLKEIIKNKNYFVLTTNVDHCFQKHGFDKTRLFYTQGDYGLWQCSVPCHNTTYDNYNEVKEMIKQQKNLKIPTELIPYCPKCKKPMTMNLRKDNFFVEDAGWIAAKNRYDNFIKNNINDKILFLELGVGENTPGIIKYPFWQYTYKFENAKYICINLTSSYAPNEIIDKSICIKGDIKTVISQLI